MDQPENWRKPRLGKSNGESAGLLTVQTARHETDPTRLTVHEHEYR